MMICRLRQNACIEERCQKGKEDLSQASFKYTHFAVAGKSSHEDERRSLRHHHVIISDAEGLKNKNLWQLTRIFFKTFAAKSFSKECVKSDLWRRP